MKTLKQHHDLGKSLDYIQNLNMKEACNEASRLGLDRYPLDRYLEICPGDEEDRSEFWMNHWIRNVQIALLEETSILRRMD